MRGEAEVGGPALSRNVRQIRERLGLSQTAFAAKVGLSQQTISKLELGKSVHTRQLHRIAALAGCGVADLLSDNQNTWPGPITQRRVPILTFEQAADWDTLREVREMPSNIAYTTYAVSPGAYALVVQGDSMVNPSGTPSYPPGCTIIVDPVIPAEPGKRVVYRLPGNKAASFSQLESDGSRLWLKPLNPRYPVTELPAGAKYCGTVVQTLINET